MYVKRGQRVGPNGYINPYFKRKHIYLKLDWNYFRSLGKKTLTPQAQLKLEWMILYNTVFRRNAKRTAEHFGITRKTFHKWLSRFDEKNLLVLEELKRMPIVKRGWQVTSEEETNIIDLRKRNMEYGKKKLKVLYKREYGKVVSTWKIERVIRRHKLFPDRAKHDIRVKRQQKSKLKVRIHELKEQIREAKEFGFLWHIDAVIIWWYGSRRIIFTALEDKTKIAFARVYKSNTSSFSEDFLKRLMYLVEGKIEIMHSDNGSEFAGLFEQACRKLGIVQVYSRPHTPKDNPSLEKFNDTIQREWLALSEIGLDDIEEANKDLTTWLIKYNSYRPHETLDYLTPLEYAQENFFKVSPMWSASSLR